MFREDADIRLLAEPRVCIWRAYTHKHGERDGWNGFMPYDPPEGTRAIFSFPSLPFALFATGVLGMFGFKMWSPAEGSKSRDLGRYDNEVVI